MVGYRKGEMSNDLTQLDDTFFQFAKYKIGKNKGRKTGWNLTTINGRNFRNTRFEGKHHPQITVNCDMNETVDSCPVFEFVTLLRSSAMGDAFGILGRIG